MSLQAVTAIDAKDFPAGISKVFILDGKTGEYFLILPDKVDHPSSIPVTFEKQ
jgi:hypothetical protein